MAPVCLQQMSPEPRAPGTPVSRQKSIHLSWLLVLSAAFGVTGFAEQVLTPGADHWAFTPPRSQPIPKVRQQAWCRTAVDRFILERLEQRQIQPSPPAGRRTLLRRLAFATEGIPPAAAELARFEADQRPDAWEREVERRLASPHLGVRLAQGWLDAAGYADSNGYFNADSDRPHAWRYRDYVIQSFNQNKPFDRFLHEQIAGDELMGFVRDGDVQPGQVESIVATHFLRNAPDGTGESDGNPLEVKVDRYAVLEGNVQIIGSSILGLTLQCARCHNHKFEPVTQEDYYGLQALLRPALDPDRWLKPGERLVQVGTRQERQERKRAIEAWEQDTKSLREAAEAVLTPFRNRILEANLAALPEADRKAIRKALNTVEKDRSEAQRSLLKQHEALWRIDADTVVKRFPEVHAAWLSLQAAQQKRMSEKPAPAETLSHLAESAGTNTDHHLLIRGNHANEGKVVPPSLPQFVASAPKSSVTLRPVGSPSKTSGRRLALAHWLTDPANPLVARVAVNRIWKHYFGAGLVPTTENLGASGARPSHRELLDFLAVELIRSGWDYKHLHRLILLSNTFQQTSRGGADSLERDPEGTWLSRMRVRRLDAEQVRDAMFFVTGELSPVLMGPYTPVKKNGEGQVIVEENAPGGRRRALFMQRKRTEPLNLLEVFDAPPLNPACVNRTESTVVLQALTLLNADFSRSRARALAESHPVGRAENVAAALSRLFTDCLGRPPEKEEIQAVLAFLGKQRDIYGGTPEAFKKAWTDCCQMVLASNEFLYID